MDLGDWIGAIVLIISIVGAAFSEKKKKDTSDNTRRAPSPGSKRSGMRSQAASSLSYLFDMEELEETYERDSHNHSEPYYKEDSQAPAKTVNTVSAAPPIPAIPVVEGERVTVDTPPLPSPAMDTIPSSAPFSLRDKDALRRAIILSEILPPKF